MDNPTIETLHGLTVSETEVTIAVASSGCTDKDDFQIVVKESQTIHGRPRYAKLSIDDFKKVMIAVIHPDFM